MNIQEITAALETWAPVKLAESYDNAGLIVGHPLMTATGTLVNLDLTEEVIEEAKKKGLNLIVTHHPIWFAARKRLNSEDYVSRCIVAAIKADIALYAIHTNLDAVRDGVNAVIASRLGLQAVRFLKPGPEGSAPVPGGMGMIGTLPQPMKKADFLAFVKETFGCGGIRYADFPGEMISQVAVCGGSGSFLTGEALRQGADAFVTADITYHKFFDNENRLLLLDIGHYESEQFTSELICTYLSEKFPNFAVHLSGIYTNPVKYF